MLMRPMHFAEPGSADMTGGVGCAKAVHAWQPPDLSGVDECARLHAPHMHHTDVCSCIGR
jgi:hypothetical protein